MSRLSGVWRPLSLRALTAALLALGAGAAWAQANTISYVPNFFGRLDGVYLVESKPANRARLVAYNGVSEGGSSGSSSQRLITLDSVLTDTVFADELDCNGFAFQQRRDINRVLFRRASGTTALGVTEVVEFGNLTDLGGCTPGLVTPFGSASDPGSTALHRAMTQRAPITDLVPNVNLAGFSEDAVAQDVVKFLSGNRVRFNRTGTTTSAAPDANNWLILNTTGAPRGYTRLSVNAANGAETWLKADFAGGLPVTVTQALMVKPAAGASFGTVAKASREWESGLFINSRIPFFTYLYQNGTGERINVDLDAGTEVRTPVTWAFDGANIEQTRIVGTSSRLRTWQPLRNAGKVRWVFEDELIFPAAGGSIVLIPFRVNFYVDRGPATPLLGSAAAVSAPMAEHTISGRRMH